jgi:NAD-specific glutamate dehydrogenase
VADVGCSFFADVSGMTGASTDDVLQAYLNASEVCSKESLVSLFMGVSTPLAMEDEYRVRLCVEDALEETVYWMLSHPEVKVQQMKEVFEHIWKVLARTVETDASWCKALMERGVSVDHVKRIQCLSKTADILDVVSVMLAAQDTPERSLWAMQAVASTGIRTLVSYALQSSSPDELDRPARMSVKAHMREHSVFLAQRVLREEKGMPAEHSESVKQLFEALRRDIGAVKEEEQPLCNLVVLAERIRRRLRS